MYYSASSPSSSSFSSLSLSSSSLFLVTLRRSTVSSHWKKHFRLNVIKTDVCDFRSQEQVSGSFESIIIVFSVLLICIFIGAASPLKKRVLAAEESKPQRALSSCEDEPNRLFACSAAGEAALTVGSSPSAPVALSLSLSLVRVQTQL